MPELPDLQVFASNLDKSLKNKKVSGVNASGAKKLNVSQNELKQSIVGAKIKHIYRAGKELRILFNNDNILGLHLMLHGTLYLFENKNTHKNAIIELEFEDGTGLVLTDWQGMATPTLNPTERDAPDALDKAVNFKFLKEAFQSKAAVKNILLDQNVIRGIGNAYADEILWESKISPFSTAGKIPDDYLKALAKAIRQVLTNAEKEIRKSHPRIISGEVRDFLHIHNAHKSTSPGGASIQTKKSGGRTTYFTDEQVLFK